MRNENGVIVRSYREYKRGDGTSPDVDLCQCHDDLRAHYDTWERAELNKKADIVGTIGLSVVALITGLSLV